MKNIRRRIDQVISRLLIILMGIMVVNVLWQVASRYLLSAPSNFTDELAGFLLIWVGLLGAGYATGQKLHLAIDLLPNKLTGKPKQRLEIIIDSFVIVFAILVMLVGGANLVYITLSLEQVSSALGIPLGYVYIVIPISGILIIFYAISDILINLQKQLPDASQ